MTLSFVVANTNTGAVTIDVDGLGAKEITVGATTLIAGQLNAGGIAAIEYDGTRFQLMNVSGATTFTNITATTTTTSALVVNGNNISAVNSLGFRNRIINGNMVIDQRNAGASVTPANGQYIVDRFTALLTQISKFSVQQNAGGVALPTGFSNYLGVTSLSSFAVSGSDILGIGQYIEGFNTSDLGFGTANAQAVTLSFRVYSSLTGTFGGVLQNNAATRSYPFTYTVSSANTWTSISVTIAGDTTGTWVGATNGVGLRVIWGLGCGPTVSGTAGAWASSGLYSATGAVSVVGTNGATFYITGVQLEAGSVATPFEQIDYGRELMMCQRYCFAQRATSVFYPFGVSSANITTPVAFINFPAPMRAPPTLLSSSAGSTFQFSSGTATSILLDQVSETNGFLFGSGGASATAGFSGRFLANNTTSAFLIWSAEL
jgi:hypothetical protein